MKVVRKQAARENRKPNQTVNQDRFSKFICQYEKFLLNLSKVFGVNREKGEIHSRENRNSNKALALLEREG